METDTWRPSRAEPRRAGHQVGGLLACRLAESIRLVEILLNLSIESNFTEGSGTRFGALGLGRRSQIGELRECTPMHGGIRSLQLKQPASQPVWVHSLVPQLSLQLKQIDSSAAHLQL